MNIATTPNVSRSSISDTVASYDLDRCVTSRPDAGPCRERDCRRASQRDRGSAAAGTQAVVMTAPLALAALPPLVLCAPASAERAIQFDAATLPKV